MSTLMFWNKQNANANQNNEAKNGKKNWLHAPDALVNGHVAYLVKFLGATPVDQAKGIDTVKDAIRRLQFAQQIKKAEGNNLKTKKVEITISVDGVAVQEPRVQKVLYQFPLHDISYCADEKGVKKFFSFIAKSNNSVPNGDVSTTTTTANPTEESHKCFVFISSKLASDITLTIGQAFELAYRRYMNDGTKITELSKAQLQNKQLENTASVYRQRLKDCVDLLPRAELDRLLQSYGVRDILEVAPLENGISNHVATINGRKTPDLGIDVTSPNNDDQFLIETSPKHFAPMVPPRNLQNQINSTLEAFKPSVGTKLEGLLLNSDSDSDFDPRADESDTSSTTNGGSNGGGNKISNDLFGFEPPQKSLGQQLFITTSSTNNGNSLTPSGAINQSLANGITMINSNGNGYQVSPPPLLAPPPKAGIPRRSGGPAPLQNNVNNNNNNNHINNKNSQDLFGSMPFNALQSSPFDASYDGRTAPNPSVTCTFDNFDNTTTLATTTTTTTTTHTTTNETSPFVKVSNTSNTFSSIPVITTSKSNANPFTESGMYLNDSISLFASQKSKSIDFSSFDDAFKSSTDDADGSFSGSLKGIDFGRPASANPFCGPAAASFTEPIAVTSTSGPSSTGVNYDAFRLLAMDDNNTLHQTPPRTMTAKSPTPENGSAGAGMARPLVDNNLFKDAAANAFMVFGKSPSNNSTPIKHEYSDRNAEWNGKNETLAGKNNFNKTIGFSADDFTLESLDPLRK